MPTIIPIPIHRGHSRPLTEHEAKVMLGCFIILSAIWVVSSIFLVMKFYKEKKNRYMYDSFLEWYFMGDYIWLGLFNGLMVFCYGFGILIWMGSLVARCL